MLKELKISNYVLIDNLELSPANNINIITGETGAGKSIILGAINLLTGKRADSKTLLNIEKKCYIEGTFLDYSIKINTILEQQDIDIESELIIRREILPSGKSRAFVNDTPVKLETLKSLAPLLLDVHSQHQTLLLKNHDFQLNMIDGFASTVEEVKKFKHGFHSYLKLKSQLESLKVKQQNENQELDYNRFLYKELKEVQLDVETDSKLEEELSKIENTENIKTALIQASQILNEEQYGTINSLHNAASALKTISDFGADYEKLNQRINSLIAESEDILSEVESSNEDLIYDHEKAFELKGRVDIINKLFVKHKVNSLEELIQITDALGDKLTGTENLESLVFDLEKEVKSSYKSLFSQANKISQKRDSVLLKLESDIKSLLSELGMENAELKIERSNLEELTSSGIDNIQFLFSANKGIVPSPIQNVASGGEFARLMFTLKYISANHTALPTIVFDEIDTGISGEVALKMSQLMEKMSKNHQLLIITHLPQIASKGKQHYYVYKDHSTEKTISQIKKLSNEERVNEIGQMLSGINVTESARNNAKELLGFA